MTETTTKKPHVPTCCELRELYKSRLATREKELLELAWKVALLNETMDKIRGGYPLSGASALCRAAQAEINKKQYT